MIQWFGAVTDHFIAPEFSTLVSFQLPEVPELPNYHGSFFLNNALGARVFDRGRPLIFAMLRNLAIATREYRSVREILQTFGSAKSGSNDAISIYLRALTHFEQTVIRTDLAISLNHAVIRSFDPTASKHHYEDGKNSPEERVRLIHNKIKHFDIVVLQGKLPECAAPVWFTHDGLKSIFESVGQLPPTQKVLKFEEIASMLSDLAENAKFVSEDVYRLIYERQANKVD